MSDEKLEAVPAAAVAKHGVILNAILGLEKFEVRLKEFNANLAGEPLGEVDKPLYSNDLATFLIETPGRINNIVEELHDTLNSIEAKLF